MSQKHLHIARHGKSSWDFENLSDIDRPLSLRGIDNVYLMAQKLSERKVVPDRILTSPACRALYTAAIYARVMKLPYEKIRVSDSIYTGNSDDLVGLIRSQEDSVSQLMIVGHNPAFTSLANQLMSHYLDNIPTSGIVSLTYRIDSWEQIGKTAPESDFFDYPKRYAE
jgi:phosphohistidine phosphatase